MLIERDNSKILCQKLLQEMRCGAFAQSRKLPRETELAAYLGISRTQLRDVLAELEREGFITRRLGVGTVINHHVVSVRNRMDIETEFFDMIRNSGYTPKVKNIKVREDIADEDTASRLNVPVGTEVFRMSRVCTADGKPVIYCEDVMDKNIVKRDCVLDDLRQLIFDFLEKYCDTKPYMDLTNISAALSDATVSQELEIPLNTPLLVMEETDYDIEGNVIFCSKQYYVNNSIEHTVLRMKL